MDTNENGSIKFHEQVAFDLLKIAKRDFALSWVFHKSKIYWAQAPRVTFEPYSSTIKLIQFLFDQFVDHSFFILRTRIYSLDAVSSMDKAFVDLCAKRITGKVVAKDHGIDLSRYLKQEMGVLGHLISSAHLEELNLEPPKYFHSQTEAMAWAREAAISIRRGTVLHDHNRPIAAVMMSAQGEVLEWATANNHKNKSLHAEVHMIQKYYREKRRPVPRGTQIFVTLKPCRMCAELIAHMSEDLRSNSVFYLEEDLGRLAKNTILEKENVLKRWPKDV